MLTYQLITGPASCGMWSLALIDEQMSLVIGRAGIYTADMNHCPLNTDMISILKFWFSWAIMKAGDRRRQLVDPDIHDLASDPTTLITWTTPVYGA